MQLLLVDDMKLINNTLHDLFTKRGYSVDQAFTLAEALDQINSRTYDYIILDLILPDGEGEELLQSVLRGSKRQSRVIVLTSDDDMQRRQYFFQNGALDYFVKNQSLEYIASKIHSLIQNTADNHKNSVAIIDDSTFIRNSLKALLEVRNYRVLTAPDAKTGMQMLLEENVALLILDLEMPHMRGDELLDKLKRNPRFLELPVIILSGSNDRDAIARVMKAGADDFIQKPYATEELLLKIDAHISSQRKAKALAHREQLLLEYQRVVDMADIVCKINPNGTITYVNEQFCAYSGYAPHELIGQNIAIVNHPEVPPSFYEDMWKTLRARRSWSGFFRNLRKDGSDYYIDSTIAPLLDEEGNIAEYISLSHDITALMQAKTISEEIAQAKTQFLAHMSHEIRTPLNAINGYLHLLQQGTLDTTQRKYLAVVDNSSKMLIDLINNILDQAKAQSGKLELNPEPCSLQKELEPIISLFAAKADEAAVNLISYIDPSLPEEISVDTLRLKQILSNLIGNAIKFTPNGGEVRVVVKQLASDAQNVTVEFYVEDTGIGISPEAQEKIFSPFQQASNKISKHFGGTGLGLSISQEYVALLGGDLLLNSEQNHGSRFSFILTLPVETALKQTFQSHVNKVAIYTDTLYSEKEIELIQEYLAHFGIVSEHNITFTPHEDAELHLLIDHRCTNKNLQDLVTRLPQDKSVIITQALQRSEALFGALKELRIFRPPLGAKDWREILRPQQHSGEYYELSGHVYEGKKVLIAEDNDVNSTLLGILLDEAGMQSEVAATGLEAVEMCRHTHYDLILTDIHMPDLNGIEAAQRIRALPMHEHTPIIVISGSEGMIDQATASSAFSFDGKLLKPLEAAKLFELLQQIWPEA